MPFIIFYSSAHSFLFLIDMHIQSLISMRRDYEEIIIPIARNFDIKKKKGMAFTIVKWY